MNQFGQLPAHQWCGRQLRGGRDRPRAARCGCKQHLIMMPLLYRTITAISVLLAVFPAVSAQTITVTGGWHVSITAADLVGGGGSNLRDTHISDSASAWISIAGAEGAWHISLRKEAGAWPDQVRLWARRTSAGSFVEGSTINGPLTYIEMTEMDTMLCAGVSSGSGVAVEYRITGMSTHVPTGIHEATLSYILTTDD
jgi:hypothetical protein